ncbi:MAG: hypothetical protein QG553_169 [Patescibacteria group bacterium]|nr:hypothetical protein [Patescibacteria group bacterium]
MKKLPNLKTNTSKFIMAVLFMAGMLFGLQGTALAANDPGCYSYAPSSPGFAKIDCEVLKTVYPSLDPAADGCYYSWATGFGPSPPVKVGCDSPPDPKRGILQPTDGKAGNPVKTNLPFSNKEDIQADPSFNGTQCNGKEVTSSDNCIIENVNVAINILSGSIGLIVIIVIIIAGIQYTTAGGDPQRIGKAKNRIRNAIFALVAYMFLYGFLQWIVPGGL